jgi:hypothetical protein
VDGERQKMYGKVEKERKRQKEGRQPEMKEKREKK